MPTQESDAMTTELVRQEQNPLAPKLTAAEIRAEVNLIQQVLKAVMIKDVHYGTIPGTPKPTLYKQGAELLLATFKLNGKPLIEDLTTDDERRYRVSVRVSHQITEKEIGWGVGECSSDETKYKWIAAIKQEWDETPEDRRRKKWSSKQGKTFQKLQVRAHIPDVSNTVLKMAKKRALVDAALTCTHASDIFDQDIEDMPEEMRQNIATPTARPPMPQPAQAPAPAANGPAPAPDPDAYYDEEPPEEKSTQHKLDMSKASKMAANFDAPCKVCGVMIKTKEPMLYSRDVADKGRYHVGCVQG
jgi:hypothetical protein